MLKQSATFKEIMKSNWLVTIKGGRQVVVVMERESASATKTREQLQQIVGKLVIDWEMIEEEDMARFSELFDKISKS